MLVRRWAAVIFLSLHLFACDDGGAKANKAADGAITCPSLGQVTPPTCVDSTTVNPNRVAVATVTQTRSTNSDGYSFTLYDDGSAEGGVSSFSISRALSWEACHLPSATPLVLACLNWLAQAGDISQIPVSINCGKSISFGTFTSITYGGISSIDLQCVDVTRYPCKDFSYCTSLLDAPTTSYPQQQDGGTPGIEVDGGVVFF
jgi:hypothetical protein